MISPDYPDFARLSRNGNLIALVESLPADLETPVSSFLKLAADAPHAYLLESAEQEEKIGRYSVIGLRPEKILMSKGGEVHRTQGQKTAPVKNSGHLLDVLEEEASGFHLANPESLPGFCGGFVGYLSYENIRDFETIRLTSANGPRIPEGIFFLSRDFLIFDHFRKTLAIVVIVSAKDKKKMRPAYLKALKKIAGIRRLLEKPLRQMQRGRRSSFDSAKLLHSRLMAARQSFESKVRRVQSYIRAGDCIQVVLSERFTFSRVGDDFKIYRALRSINPSPYMFYFRSGPFRLIGSSPEVLVKKTGRTAEVRPIAGTRPRGKTVREDQSYEIQLKKSPKELAEHVMLVDLGRNDLGRVCEFDSIRVLEFARVERYSHVMHLVSDVRGRLRSGKNSFDLLRATFPAGTVSGAPKIRAMQIIDELERTRRGPYAGCLGYFSFNHDMDMCITIRTLVIDRRYLHIQAGAGIVKDSQPSREYQEILNKAGVLFRAVQQQAEF